MQQLFHSFKARQRRASTQYSFFVPKDSKLDQLILRKAFCSCGGGCPVCHMKSNGLTISQPHDSVEIEADQIADQIMRMPEDRISPLLVQLKPSSNNLISAPRAESREISTISGDIRDRIASSLSSGSKLNNDVRVSMEARFGRDFGDVNIHTDEEAVRMSRRLAAQAFTVGKDIYFNKDQYCPHSENGQHLLAHELTHVVQGQAPGETEGVRRRVEMRNVGRGESSGFARVQQLIDRLNGGANGLVFWLDGNNDLRYVENPYGTITEFERRMQAFIDSDIPIRLRLTNHRGLLRGPGGGFTRAVDEDDFRSGYVDIDDLIAADDLPLQTIMIHFLTERAVTKEYTRRIGTEFSDVELRGGHAAGIDAETLVLRNFFQDNTIRFVNTPASERGMGRVWTNSRRDLIRAPFHSSGGVFIVSIEVRLHDRRTMSATEYRDFIANARAVNPNP